MAFFFLLCLAQSALEQRMPATNNEDFTNTVSDSPRVRAGRFCFWCRTEDASALLYLLQSAFRYRAFLATGDSGKLEARCERKSRDSVTQVAEAERREVGAR